LQEYDYDLAGAEREYLRAIELNPNYATAHQFYSRLLSYQGRHDESYAVIRRALELDPLSIPINWFYGLHFRFARKYDQSIAQLKKTIELDPNFASAYGALSEVYVRQGKYAEAGELAAKNAELNGYPERAAWIRENYTRLGRQEYLRMIISGKSPLQPNHYSLAQMYAELGEKDKTLVELNKAYENREGNLFPIKTEPRFDLLRDDLRFQELLRKIGFPP
jgi:tetratricopeptide (TPR) repeat protein